LAVTPEGVFFERREPVLFAAEKKASRDAARRRTDERAAIAELAKASHEARAPFVGRAGADVKGAVRNRLMWLCLAGDVREIAGRGVELVGGDNQGALEDMSDGRLANVAWLACLQVCENNARHELEQAGPDRGEPWRGQALHVVLSAYYDTLARAGYEISEFETQMLDDVGRARTARSGRVAGAGNPAGLGGPDDRDEDGDMSGGK
jgi:hypothetical protein